jgi:hypothetical protein
MNHSRHIFSGLTIANVIEAYRKCEPDLIHKFPVFTPNIRMMKVMRFELFAYNIPGIIPNLKMVERLIYMPEVESDDPYHLERYRVRPQMSDSESEDFLVSRNNRLTAWLDRKRINPTSFDLALSDWCRKHDVSYKQVSYFKNVIEYCRLILPGTYSNPDKGSENIKALKKLDNLAENVDYSNALGENSQLTDRLHETFKRDYYLSRRFPEYEMAVTFIYRMEQHPTYIKELRTAHLDEASRINTENRTDDNKRASGEFDCKILTQCMFCYRFHKQDPVKQARLSKYCPDHEKDFNTWRKYLTGKGVFKQSHVYRDGFYRYQKP